ncbi:unnamed protein product [Didymodactylos carnosus]|uniref:Uncharacterized protein n=1 Tax=Didymodactylos carnosus TaxID=1234261 RepID=A0A814CPC9_9BILA|nr:unnamed protein product [Didymodactylos carnosus]CAF1345762.1 unnamed protein product [Didymodactylos carnosus]CAF3719268.1 unnamed protein product [Didymodactylos carnosus]CAF4156663.1 unnamed protein product [Didymodactylos carnosus]
MHDSSLHETQPSQQQHTVPNGFFQEPTPVIVPVREPWRKRSCYQKFLSIIKNEVTWGVFVLLWCAIALIIIWAANTPVKWQQYKDPVHEQGLIAIIGGIFAIVASGMSIVQMIQHFVHKTHRPSQKRVIRIIAMVPVYAMTSWLSLIFFPSAIYMNFVQSCFEAYVIYCFLLLLTKYLGGHRGVEEVIMQKETIKLTFPFGYCYKPVPHIRWVWYFKFGLLQYSWINPLCSGIAVVLNLAGLYADGQWKFNRGYPYITFIINVSQSLALYCLVTFYENTNMELKPFKPLPKFIVIKLIVFFIFWQSVLMSGLAFLKVLRNTTCDSATNAYCKNSTVGFTVEQEKILLENILICVEMVFFSIAHHWIFSWRPYADGTFKELMESRYRNMNNKDDAEVDGPSTWF